MEAKCLRIGNYVFQEKEIGTIILELKSGYEMEHILQMPNIYEPIPLTEEWLIKFGFERNLKDGSWQNKGSFPLTFYFDGVRLSVKFYQGNEKLYVHQLQNLYFELTNSELEIKNLDK
jgi:hypothetical protein